MKLSDIRSKFNFKALSFVLGDARYNGIGKKPAWITQMSHGQHVIEYQPSVRGYYVDGSEALNFDSVLVQREQISHLDLWLFGVCDDGVGTQISGYLQSHLFDKKPKEVITKCKETIRKAYLNARGKCKEAIEECKEEKANVGSASIFVINGDKIVIASMGEYRAVVCRDGMASSSSSRHLHVKKRYWPHKFILGAFNMPKVRVKAQSSFKYRITRSWRTSEIAISSQRVDSETEFIILGSPGVWEVMKNQEAVNLIRHIEDAQKAAECLAREAMIRMSRKNISCLVIRFD